MHLPKVVVFGIDSSWRPHAAWFPPTQGKPGAKAAKQLRLNVIDVTNGTAADLIAKLPAGQIHAAGPAMVPPSPRRPVREGCCRHQSTRARRAKNPGEPTTAGLPWRTWATIKPGHLVLIQDSLVGRLVRGDCRWPNWRPRSPSGPATTPAFQTSPSR